MRKLPLILIAASVLCAATTTRDYRRLLDEPAPTVLPIPVAGVRVSQIRDSWGAARSEGRTHEGIDIMAPRGAAVLSATHGVVADVQWRDRGGNTVSVIGPGGHRHYYAHLDAYGRYVSGDWIEVGDTLGFVGTTGNAEGTSPHLHYGIYTTDGAINPFPFLIGKASVSTSTPARTSTAGKSTTSKSTMETREPKRAKRRVRTSRRGQRNSKSIRTSTTEASSNSSTQTLRRR